MYPSGDLPHFVWNVWEKATKPYWVLGHIEFSYLICFLFSTIVVVKTNTTRLWLFFCEDYNITWSDFFYYTFVGISFAVISSHAGLNWSGIAMSFFRREIWVRVVFLPLAFLNLIIFHDFLCVLLDFLQLTRYLLRFGMFPIGTKFHALRCSCLHSKNIDPSMSFQQFGDRS